MTQHPRFDGDDYQPGRDDPRLAGQMARIWSVVSDWHWHTLPELVVEYIARTVL